MRLSKKSKEPCTCNLHPDYATCCDTFKEFLNDCRVGLKYNKYKRRFSILIARDMGSQGINNCPWCGFQLPSDLADEREKILLEEFNIDIDNDEDEKRIPEEFKTDEWWKKRGL